VLGCRLIGVIEGGKRDGNKTQRNDRLIAVETHTQRFEAVKTLQDLGKRFVGGLEAFFVNYHELSEHKFRVLGARGPKVARTLVNDAIKKRRK
jgi:inorganic pyrophosphatase